MNKMIIFGIGKWGKNLLRIFYSLKVLKYVNDKKIKKNLYNLEYKSKNYIIKDKKITSVIISTPIKTHINLSIFFIKNNKNIFVEKPLTINKKELFKLEKLNKKYKKKIMCGYLLIYHPVFIKLKRLINSNYVGRIKKIYLIRTDNIKNNFKNNILWDYGPHDISILLSIIKAAPQDIKIIKQKTFLNSIYKIFVKMKYKYKLDVHIFLSYKNKKKIRLLKIIGQKKSIIFDDTKQWKEKLKIFFKKKFFYIRVKYKEPLLNECEYFTNIINKEKSPLTDINNSKKITEIIESISKICK